MEFFEVVKKIGIFIICAQAVIHFKPSAKYEKYLRLLVSIMVLVQLIIPVMNMVSKEGEEQFIEKVSELQSSMEKSMGEIETENFQQEQSILNETVEEVKTRFNNIAQNYGLKVYKLEWENSDLSGKITAYVGEENKLDTTLIHIEPIGINSSLNNTDVQKEETNQMISQDILHALSKEFAKALSISEEEIEVKSYE